MKKFNIVRELFSTGIIHGEYCEKIFGLSDDMIPKSNQIQSFYSPSENKIVHFMEHQKVLMIVSMKSDSNDMSEATVDSIAEMDTRRGNRVLWRMRQEMKNLIPITNMRPIVRNLDAISYMISTSSSEMSPLV